MENRNIIFEILISDYKSLRTQQNSLLILKYVVFITLLLTQLILDNKMGYVIFPIVLFFGIMIYLKGRSISEQLGSINRMMINSRYTDDLELKFYQEMKFRQFGNLNSFFLMQYVEISIWITFSAVILILKIKYAC